MQSKRLSFAWATKSLFYSKWYANCLLHIIHVHFTIWTYVFKMSIEWKKFDVCGIRIKRLHFRIRVNIWISGCLYVLNPRPKGAIILQTRRHSLVIWDIKILWGMLYDDLDIKHWLSKHSTNQLFFNRVNWSVDRYDYFTILFQKWYKSTSFDDHCREWLHQ